LLESAVDYDVLIAGGSFAGLAAAAQLRGKRVLLVEPRGIGTVRTSACGTLLAVLEATGTMDSLLQVHDRCSLHLPDRTFEYPTPYPFCTFDYRALCNLLLAQADVEILHASVLGHRGHLVRPPAVPSTPRSSSMPRAGVRRWLPAPARRFGLTWA